MYKSLTLLALASTALGHLSLKYPPPLGGNQDPEANFPLGCCGTGGAGPNKEAVASRMPPGQLRGCRGHENELDNFKIETTWKAGEKVSFVLESNHPNGLSTTHYGGSCQTGFSFDKLKTTHVATSFPGSCPKRPNPSDQTFSITVPSDIPSGNALFIWTFNNREGEFFESCAPVKIVGGSGAASDNATEPEQPSGPTPSTNPAPGSTSTADPSIQTSPNEVPDDAAPPVEGPEGEGEPEACTGRRCHSWEQRKTRAKRTVPWNQRPPMLFNDFPGAECFSQAYQDEQHSTELEYPNPGPDVVEGDGEYPLALPKGAKCGV